MAIFPLAVAHPDHLNRAPAGRRKSRSIDLTQVREGERFALWDDFLTQNISRHARQPAQNGPFIGNMQKDALGFLNRFTVKSSAFRSSVTPEILSSGRHNSSYIMILPKLGKYHLQQDGFEALLSDWDMALLDSNLSGSIVGSGYCSHTMISLPRKAWEDYAPPPILEGNFKLDFTRATARIARSFLTEVEAHGQSMAPGELETLSRHLLHLLALYFETGSDSVPDTITKEIRIRKIKSFVRASIQNPNLGPAMVADHFGISTRYIARLLSEVNITLMDYIWETRLQAAEKAIRQSVHNRHTIKNIAHRFGFNNQSHFSTKFSSRFGDSPSQYRRHNAVDAPLDDA